MTDKEKQRFITSITKEHEECRQRYNAGGEEERLIAWGKMEGLEKAAHYACMTPLRCELAELRRRYCDF